MNTQLAYKVYEILPFLQLKKMFQSNASQPVLHEALLFRERESSTPQELLKKREKLIYYNYNIKLLVKTKRRFSVNRVENIVQIDIPYKVNCNCGYYS